MHTYENVLNSLREQTRKGDIAAALRLERELGPNVVMMVRQTMMSGAVKTPMDRRIRVEARRRGLTSGNERGAERDRLIHEVADSVCRSYVAELRSPPRQSIPAAETVNYAAAAVAGIRVVTSACKVEGRPSADQTRRRTA